MADPGAWGIYLWHTGELHGALAEQSAVCSFWKVLIWKTWQENPECGTERYSGQQITISLLRHSPLTCHWALGQSRAWLQHTRWPCWPSGKGAVRPTQPQTGVVTITRQTRQDRVLKAQASRCVWEGVGACGSLTHPHDASFLTYGWIHLSLHLHYGFNELGTRLDHYGPLWIWFALLTCDTSLIKIHRIIKCSKSSTREGTS